MKIGIDVNILRNYTPRLIDMYYKEYEKSPSNEDINPYALEDSFDDEIFDFIGENILEIFGFAKESERGIITSSKDTIITIDVDDPASITTELSEV